MTVSMRTEEGNKKERIFIVDYYNEFCYEAKAEEWSENIENAYSRYNVKIAVESWRILPDRILFLLKLKGGTREKQVFDRAHDVQLRLKLPLFLPITSDFRICIVASDQRIVYDHLLHVLSADKWKEKMEKMVLPYVVGHDIAVGGLVVVDLSRFIHLLMGGATNSGKTVGLQALVVSMAYSKSPNQVNFILIDVGATNLMPFAGIPHLSYPMIRDSDTAYKVLSLLKAEMERRIELQETESDQFKKLPRLVLVIDEFPALLAGIMDKVILRSLTGNISGLLQRGRHAKIHVILAAQNPTIQNMKVDLGNITARIAFRCAKRNFSETILGEGGAENLSGKGEMYLTAPQYEGLQRVQGIFVSPKELWQAVHYIRDKWKKILTRRKFIINEEMLQQAESDCMRNPAGKLLAIKMDRSAKLFAEVTLWALSQDSVSCNMISENFSVGWRRANGIIKKLNECGIVGDLDAKLPRKVLPTSVDEIPQKTMQILLDNGFSAEDVSIAIYSRD